MEETNARLRFENKIVNYSMVFRSDEKVSVIYEDTGKEEVFYNVYLFLYDLSLYYRSRLDSLSSFNDKIALCETFKNFMYMYLTDWRNMVKDTEKLHKELFVYINQFDYFQSQFQKNNTITTSSNKESGLSTDEKIIVLEFLGALKVINDSTKNVKDSNQLLALLLDRNIDNLTKANRNVRGLPKEKGAIKSLKTLNTVISLADRLNFEGLKVIAQQELDKIGKK